VRQRIAAAIGISTLLLFGSSCGGSASPPTTTGPIVTARPAPCPSKAPTTEPSPARSGLDVDLVPPGPVYGTVCRYQGFNGTAKPGSLVRSHLLSGAALTSVVALFDSPRWQVITQPAVYNCPMDDGASDMVEFAYPTGPAARVRVALSGCRFASNGVRTVAGYAIGQLLAAWVGTPTT
jgi:hypothetical protein